MDARAPLTVPPLQIRLPPRSLNQSGFKQETFDDDASSGDSDEFNNSLDKEELETYHDDSNSHLDEYEQEDSLMTKHVGKNSNLHFMKELGDMEDDESDEHIVPDSSSDSEAEVDVAGPSSDPPLLGTKQPSLYLLENAKKKIILKDGKLVAARQKAQRKDKGVFQLSYLYEREYLNQL